MSGVQHAATILLDKLSTADACVSGGVAHRALARGAVGVHKAGRRWRLHLDLQPHCCSRNHETQLLDSQARLQSTMCIMPRSCCKRVGVHMSCLARMAGRQALATIPAGMPQNSC